MKLIDADQLQFNLDHTPHWLFIRGEKHYLGFTVEDVRYIISCAPAINAIPIEWIEKYAKTDDTAGSIYRMIEDWRNYDAEEN